jgi:catechol 2,3-dioxygenase-like lactoylglutathione lyase family enzyme
MSSSETHGDGGARAPASLRVRGVIETTMCCPDLDAAEAFYTEVLNFEVFAKDEGRHLFFRCGDGMLLLFNPAHTAVQVTMVGDARMPLHGTSGAGHIAFRADHEEIELWKERLAARGVEIESEVSWPEGGISIFFRDPAGNCLEFTTPVTWGLES